MYRPWGRGVQGKKSVSSPAGDPDRPRWTNRSIGVDRNEKHAMEGSIGSEYEGKEDIPSRCTKKSDRPAGGKRRVIPIKKLRQNDLNAAKFYTSIMEEEMRLASTKRDCVAGGGKKILCTSGAAMLWGKGGCPGRGKKETKA